MNEHSPQAGPGKKPSDWLQYFEASGVLAAEFKAAVNSRSKTIKAGLFLGPCVNREVRVEVRGRGGLARLRMVPIRANTKLYYFEVLWDDHGSSEDPGQALQSLQASAVAPTPTPEKSVPNVSPAQPVEAPAALPGGNDETWA